MIFIIALDVDTIPHLYACPLHHRKTRKANLTDVVCWSDNKEKSNEAEKTINILHIRPNEMERIDNYELWAIEMVSIY